jgi:hypothetical protein
VSGLGEWIWVAIALLWILFRVLPRLFRNQAPETTSSPKTARPPRPTPPPRPQLDTPTDRARMEVARGEQAPPPIEPR